MYDHLLLAAAILLGLTLLRLLRRPGGAPLGYALLLALALGLALVAIAQGQRPLGGLAIGLCTITIILPWLLDLLARRLFAAGRLTAAVQASSLRAMLMPGAGLSRQVQLLHGLVLLERAGVDAALNYFRGLLRDTEDPREELLFHEQIIAMLVYGRRWRDAIAHYESHLHLGHAVLRPALGLGLIRAYGEEYELRRAAELLRAIEDGPLGADPAAVNVVGQARLIFLAYCGDAHSVDRAAAHARPTAFGLTDANAALFHGIALARAGEPELARRRIEAIAARSDPREDRVIAAARALLSADLTAAHRPLPPELRAYVEAVAERVGEQLRGARPAARPGLAATYLIGAGMIASFVAQLLLARGGVGLIELGAFAPELVRAGSWGRYFTAGLLHADMLALILDLYAIWLGGHVVERLLGPARMLVVALGGGVFGLWIGGVTPHPGLAAIGGAPALVTAVLVAALATLAPMRPPEIARRARRSLMVTLLLLLFAQLLACLPGPIGLDIHPLSLAGAALFGALFSGGLPRPLTPRLRVLLRVLAAALVALSVAGASQVAREDIPGYIALRRPTLTIYNGLLLRLPITILNPPPGPALPGALPSYPGLRDELALRGGDLVQLVVLEARERAPDEPAIFELDPDLAREASLRPSPALPPVYRAALDAAPGAWRSYTLTRDGESIAQIIERTPKPGGARLLLIASPARALTFTPALYAAILADAAPADGDDPSERPQPPGT